MSFSQQTPAAPAYKDASIETFADDVLVASRERPVIVDFWAPWCGPCKQLAPAIEKAVADSQGAVSLVKVNIDENQMLAQQMRIQSIPAVLAFVDGQPVDGFVGALPDSDVKGFVDRLAQMAGGATSGAPDIEAALAAADEMFAAGDLAGALQLYAQIAELDPENAPALAGLARCRLASGDRDAAEQTLALVPEANRNDPAVAAVRAALDLAGTGGGDRAAAAAAVEANPDDLEARYALAEAEIAAGAMEAGVDQLLEIVGRDREWNEEAARKMLVTVFEALGPADPLTLRARRRLSSILFS